MLTGMVITRAARSTSASSARTSTGAPRRKHAIQDRRYGSIRTDAWSQSCVGIDLDATLTSERLNCTLNACLCLSVLPTFASEIVHFCPSDLRVADRPMRAHGQSGEPPASAVRFAAGNARAAVKKTTQNTQKPRFHAKSGFRFSFPT